MKITFINLPQYNSLDNALDVPLGLLYIAAICREEGHDINFVDLNFTSEIPFADIYAMTIMTTSYNVAKSVKNKCKQINPNCIVIVGGPHPTALPLETSQDFDIVVQGEGEYVVRDILRNKKFHPHIASRIPINDLNQLPLPARDIVHLTQYHRKVGGNKATSVITSRGCPFNCSFCGSKLMFDKTRYRSIKCVIDELKTLNNFDSFVFYDDTFVMNRKRLYPLLEEIKKLKISFRCNGRAGYNTYEDFLKLKESGCHTVSFGIESGSQKILDKCDKKASVQDNYNAIQDAKKAGLITKAFLIVGLPGETDETIEETKNFIDRADPDCYSLFMFVPFPGCDIWNHREDYGIKIIENDWNRYFVIAGQNEGGAVLETDTYTSSKLIEMHHNLLDYLQKRRWDGTIEEYEKEVCWRKLK